MEKSLEKSIDSETDLNRKIDEPIKTNFDRIETLDSKFDENREFSDPNLSDTR